MSNKRKKCRLLQNLYSIFLLNSKKRKKCRTKRKKCRLFKISIRHFFLNNKKRKKCRTIRHFFIDSLIQQVVVSIWDNFCLANMALNWSFWASAGTSTSCTSHCVFYVATRLRVTACCNEEIKQEQSGPLSATAGSKTVINGSH